MQKNVSRWSQALWISILQWVAQQRVYQATFLHHHWEWILRGKYPWVSECPSPELRLCRGLIREQKTLQALENHIIWENCSRGFAWEECSCVIYKDRWTVRKRNGCPRRSTIADDKDLFQLLLETVCWVYSRTHERALCGRREYLTCYDLKSNWLFSSTQVGR